MPDRCPNCFDPIEGHPDSACVLNALIQVVRERGDLTEEQLRALHRDANVDVLWEDLGPVIDRLQAGGYSTVEE